MTGTGGEKFQHHVITSLHTLLVCALGSLSACQRVEPISYSCVCVHNWSCLSIRIKEL